MFRKIATTLVASCAALGITTAVSGTAHAAPVSYLADVDDPGVTSLAAERGITISEARQRIGWQNPAAELEQELKATLGEQFGGVWIDEDDGGRVKIGFTGNAAPAKGAISSQRLDPVTDLVQVKHSYPALERASGWLGAAMAAANDGAAARLTSVILTDRNVVELRLPQGHDLTARQQWVVDQAQQRFGSAIALGSWEGKVYQDACAQQSGRFNCDAPLRGGVAIYQGTTPWCSTAFNARSLSDNKWYVMTAGHCGAPGTQFRAFQPQSGNFHIIGNVHNAIDPGTSDDDMAIIAINNVPGWNPQPWVYIKNGVGQGVPGSAEDQDYFIDGTTTNLVGSRVCMSSGFTGTSCGEVLGLNFAGVSGGKVLASYCRQGGDSGGAVINAHKAKGIHSGSASGATCGSALYQGIIEGASKLNVSVATS